jgi:hypothetical protein
MAGGGASMEAMGSSPKRGRRRGRGGGGAQVWGAIGRGRAARGGTMGRARPSPAVCELLLASCYCLCFVLTVR